MVGGCGILLERGVVGGDGMLDWGRNGNGAGGIRGENLVRRMMGFTLLYVLFGRGVAVYLMIGEVEQEYGVKVVKQEEYVERIWYAVTGLKLEI